MYTIELTDYQYQQLTSDLKDMSEIYADENRSDWFDADDTAKEIAYKLGNVLETATHTRNPFYTVADMLGVNCADRTHEAIAQCMRDELQYNWSKCPIGSDGLAIHEGDHLTLTLDGDEFDVTVEPLLTYPAYMYKQAE